MMESCADPEAAKPHDVPPSQFFLRAANYFQTPLASSVHIIFSRADNNPGSYCI